ncbi:SMP-30/gluconolactonase/LRE family protein [Marinomonas epiphytica]
MYSLDQIRFLGQNFKRPECVLTNSSQRVFTSNWDGGVSIIEPSGEHWSILANGADFPLKPNGICLLENGDFLIAHLGDKEGGVFRLQADGTLSPFITEIDGEPLPPTNYVHLDFQGRIWVTVSTRKVPRADAYRSDVNDGFILLWNGKQARVVADNLGYTNECIASPDGQYLYVNETFARQLSRYTITQEGELVDKIVITRFGEGVYPDGLALDQNEDFWITSIISNQVLHVSKSGETQSSMLIDANPDHLAWVEQAYQQHALGRPHLDQMKSELLQNISSLAFGGKDRCQLYLGCLLGDAIATLSQPVQGLAPSHWHFKGPVRPATQLEKNNEKNL